jgi:hypothetical protein
MDESGMVCSECGHCADHHCRPERTGDDPVPADDNRSVAQGPFLGKCTDDGCDCAGGPDCVAVF